MRLVTTTECLGLHDGDNHDVHASD
jgi:hypothetical protein